MAYNGLRGDEVREILTHALNQKLLEHPAFQAAIAHHSVKYKITVEMSSYPFEKTHEAVIQGTAATEGEVPAGAVKVSGTVVIEDNIRFPDKAREEAGLPLEDTAGIMATDAEIGKMF